MENETYDWSCFTKRVSIKATIESVYKMWASIQGMELWFLRLCAYKKNEKEWYAASDLVTAESSFSWYWHGWPDDVVQKGTILIANGKDEFAFTFGQKGAEDMKCSIKIYEALDEVICELKQVSIPNDDFGKSHYYIDCITSWTFYLTNLKSILEGGLDLRNKNVNLKNLLNS